MQANGDHIEVISLTSGAHMKVISLFSGDHTMMISQQTLLCQSIIIDKPMDHYMEEWNQCLVKVEKDCFQFKTNL